MDNDGKYDSKVIPIAGRLNCLYNSSTKLVPITVALLILLV